MNQLPQNAAAAAMPSKPYYTGGEITPLEEDVTHEFKAHTNFCEEEVPRWIYNEMSNRRSRMPISRTLNAFLNTGKGGTVYLGIVDTGEVKGLNLTRFKQDHLIVNLDNLMERYAPPVEKHRYKIRFVPIVPPQSPPEEILRTVNYDSKLSVDKKDRQRPHDLQSREYCWCDKDTMALCSTAGTVPMQYVVEITMKPWDPSDPRNKNATGQMKTHPLHTDECGKVYFRRQASVMQCSMQEILSMSRNVVAEHYQPKVDTFSQDGYSVSGVSLRESRLTQPGLKEEIYQLREALAKM